MKNYKKNYISLIFNLFLIIHNIIKDGITIIAVNIKNTPLDIKQNVKIIKCDVTNKADIKKSFLEIKKTFGGMDILVSNAGAPWQGDIGKVSEKIIKESFELNFFAHQYLSQAAVQTMLKQETGGVLLYNISKQSINPGKNIPL